MVPMDLSQTSDVTRVAEIILSGSLAFSGIAIGGIALAISAYLVVRETREDQLAKLFKRVLWLLSFALLTTIVAAGLSFAYIIYESKSTLPPLMVFSASFMSATLVLLLVGAGILIATISYLK